MTGHKETVLKSVAKCSSKQFPEEKVTHIFPSRVVQFFSRAHTLLAFYLFHFKMKLLNLGPGLFPTLNWQLKELYQGLFLVSHNQHCGGENQKKGNAGAQ